MTLRFYTSGDFSEGRSENNKKIHYSIVESSHNSQNQNNLRRILCRAAFYFKLRPFNSFCDEERRGQGREGTGNNYCFIDRKLMKKESL